MKHMGTDMETPFLAQCWDIIVEIIASKIAAGYPVRLEFPMGVLVYEDNVPKFNINQGFLGKLSAPSKPQGCS